MNIALWVSVVTLFIPIGLIMLGSVFCINFFSTGAHPDSKGGPLCMILSEFGFLYPLTGIWIVGIIALIIGIIQYFSS